MSTEDYPDIMVDLETTHTDSGRGAILQLAAVRFNVETQAVDGEDMFNRCLQIPNWRHWSESTRYWWMGQDQDVLTRILNSGENPSDVIEDFVAWAHAKPCSRARRLWGKPSHFEFPWIESYCKDFNHQNPFHYREVTDLNSFLRGCYFPNAIPRLNIEFFGDAHDAIFDVLNQINYLFIHIRNAAETERRPVLVPEILDHG